MKKHNHTLEDLAELLEMVPITVERKLSGQHGWRNAELKKLGKIYNCDVTYFY